jgi:hypothetical protein
VIAAERNGSGAHGEEPTNRVFDRTTGVRRRTSREIQIPSVGDRPLGADVDSELAPAVRARTPQCVANGGRRIGRSALV